MTVREIVVSVVSSVLDSTVIEGTMIDSVSNWDSLKTLQIVMELEAKGISIPLEKIAEVKSVGDFISFANGEADH